MNANHATPPQFVRPEVTNLPTSFVGRTERFYILRNEGLAIARKYAVYPNVKAYDTRSTTPEYIPAVDALPDFCHAEKIYPESLTTTPPSYPADRDETDYGLTPERNIIAWHNKFQQAVEGHNHAA